MNPDADQQDFSLTVEEVFTITGRGPVVVGSITSGIFRTGETVEIWQGGALVATTRASVEMVCRPGSDPKDRPHLDSLGLFDVDKQLLAPGHIILRRHKTAG